MTWTIHNGDCLEVLRTLADCSVQCCVTSPPYWGLRDYGVDGQLGLESTPESYVAKMAEVFREVRRVLRDDGTLWLNLGDTYGGPASNNQGGMSKIGGGKKTNNGAIFKGRLQAPGCRAKDLVGIPWRVAFALQADGWCLRQDIIWHKPNPMPESVRDRCTKAHEYIFLLTKSRNYYFDADAIREPAVTGGPEIVGTETIRSSDRKSEAAGTNGRNVQQTNSEAERRDIVGGSFNNNPRLRVTDGKRNKRSVWSVTTKPFKGAHFATFPPALIEPCILAGTKEGDGVLDPFSGSGTTGAVAIALRRNYIGVELNAAYIELSRERIGKAEREVSRRLPLE